MTGVNWRYGTIGPVWFRRLLWAWRWYWSGDYFPLSQHDMEYLFQQLDDYKADYSRLHKELMELKYPLIWIPGT